MVNSSVVMQLFRIWKDTPLMTRIGAGVSPEGWTLSFQRLDEPCPPKFHSIHGVAATFGFETGIRIQLSVLEAC